FISRRRHGWNGILSESSLLFLVLSGQGPVSFSSKISSSSRRGMGTDRWFGRWVFGSPAWAWAIWLEFQYAGYLQELPGVRKPVFCSCFCILAPMFCSAGADRPGKARTIKAEQIWKEGSD